MEKYIDLHMHSKYSDDGEFKPAELVEKCHKKNSCISFSLCYT